MHLCPRPNHLGAWALALATLAACSDVYSDSLAAEAGITTGEEVVSVDGIALQDASWAAKMWRWK
jgi:predicted metalloprotease with PDZ domain